MKRFISFFSFVVALSLALVPAFSVNAATMTGGGFVIDGAVTPITAYSSGGTFTLGTAGEPITIGNSSGGGFVGQPGFVPPVIPPPSSPPSGGGGGSLNCSIFATPAVINQGDSAVLSWNIHGTTTIELLGNNYIASTTRTVSPSVTTTYVGSVTEPGFTTIYCYRTVIVVPPVVPIVPTVPTDGSTGGGGTSTPNFVIDSEDDFRTPQECIGPDGKPCSTDVAKGAGFVEPGLSLADILVWLADILILFGFLSPIVKKKKEKYYISKILARVPVIGYGRLSNNANLPLRSMEDHPLMLTGAAVLFHIGLLLAIYNIITVGSLITIIFMVAYIIVVGGRVRVAFAMRARLAKMFDTLQPSALKS